MIRNCRRHPFSTLNLAPAAFMHSSELPSITELISTVQTCRERKDLTHAKIVYAQLRYFGLDRNDSIGNHLVAMFAECGSTVEAQQVFDRLSEHTERSWTSLICGYVECGLFQHAIDLYHRMERCSVCPSCYTLMPLLKSYAIMNNIEGGQLTHIQVMKHGFDKDSFIGSGLVVMYAKCGSVNEARQVFNTMSGKTIISWTAVISGYAEHGPGEEALRCYEQMQLQGVYLDATTLVCVLKACGSIGSLNKGREIHTDSVLKGLDLNDFVGNILVDMYSKCGSLADAQGTSNRLPARNLVSWTALIAGYAEHGPGSEAFHCFEKMKLEGIYPDAVAFASVLKACGSIGALEKGREIHREIPDKYLEKYFFLANAVVDMYLKCSSFLYAKEAFDKLQRRDCAPWHALIAGYAEQGNCQKVMECVEYMQLEGIFLDSGTYVSMLKASGSTETMQKNQELHADVIKKGFDIDLSVANTLLDMYGKQAAVEEARNVFNKMTVRDVVSWTALIAGYVEGGQPQESIAFFDEMLEREVSPNDVTFVCVLKSCVDIGAVDKGQEFHNSIIQKGFDEDISVCNALIDTYARCGSVSEAKDIFCKMPLHDIVSWNAMIKGHGINDEIDMAVQCFEEMQSEGFYPDNVTFTCLLYACSRAKLVGKGQEVFNMMTKEYGIEPTIDHCTCLVDLYAKSGRLAEILDFVGPSSSPSLWTALLTACNMHGEVDLGDRCFQQLRLSNLSHAASCVLMTSS